MTDTGQTWLSVDLLAFTDDPRGAQMVLITREGSPHQGATTLPGGVLDAAAGETVEDAARRIARTKIGAEITGAVAGLGWVSDPSRDERGHTVSLLIAARVPAGTPGAVDPQDAPVDMPFGHTGMVVRGLTVLGDRLLTDPETTYALLGETTTPSRAVALVTAITGESKAAVRARFLRSGLYVASQETAATGGRPEQVYVASRD